MVPQQDDRTIRFQALHTALVRAARDVCERGTFGYLDQTLTLMKSNNLLKKGGRTTS